MKAAEADLFGGIGKRRKGRLFPSTLRLPDDLDAAIDKLALEHGTQRSAVIKSLLRRALNLPEPAPRDPLACDPRMEKNL